MSIKKAFIQAFEDKIAAKMVEKAIGTDPKGLAGRIVLLAVQLENVDARSNALDDLDAPYEDWTPQQKDEAAALDGAYNRTKAQLFAAVREYRIACDLAAKEQA